MVLRKKQKLKSIAEEGMQLFPENVTLNHWCMILQDVLEQEKQKNDDEEEDDEEEGDEEEGDDEENEENDNDNDDDEEEDDNQGSEKENKEEDEEKNEEDEEEGDKDEHTVNLGDKSNNDQQENMEVVQLTVNQEEAENEDVDAGYQPTVNLAEGSTENKHVEDQVIEENVTVEGQDGQTHEGNVTFEGNVDDIDVNEENDESVETVNLGETTTGEKQAQEKVGEEKREGGEERRGADDEKEGQRVGDGNNTIQSQELASPFWNSTPIRNLFESALKGPTQGKNIPYITLKNFNHM